MTIKQATFRIGDRVTGNFRDVSSRPLAFVGTITTGDAYGLGVDFDTPVCFNPDRAGSLRPGAWFRHSELAFADPEIAKQRIADGYWHAVRA